MNRLMGCVLIVSMGMAGETPVWAQKVRTDIEKQEQRVDARGRKPGEVGYEANGENPAKKYVITGVYTNYVNDGPLFKPDYKQAHHPGDIFMEFKIPKLQTWLTEKKNAGENLRSADVNDYINQRVKVTFVASAQHTRYNKKIHRFRKIYLKKIEILSSPDPAQTPSRPLQRTNTSFMLPVRYPVNPA
jgi:hypothetical protein